MEESFLLETQRLVLKPHSLEHLDKFWSWENDPELLYYSDDQPEDQPPVSLDETRKSLERMSQQCSPEGEIIHYAIHLKHDGAYIGNGMIAKIDRYHRHCRIGLMIGDRSQWGKGYGKELLSAVCAYCFQTLKMHRIGAEIYSFNERSIRLFEDVGFQREGALRDSVLKRGDYFDELLYGLLYPDWKTLQ
jgi:RimJ/RimL family protein N-acetyltransferase